MIPNRNLIIASDSYKHSHFVQYPDGTTTIYSYIESRGGLWDKTVFLGAQAVIKEFLCHRVTDAMIRRAKRILKKMGTPFNEAGWRYIVDELDGRLPVRIEALPEGTVVPGKTVLLTIVNTDPRCFWLTSFLETLLLRGIWYPTTVATLSWSCKQAIWDALVQTSDDPAGQIGFKLHDFSPRGVSSGETAALGGMAHLVNFVGTDNLEGVNAAMEYYDADDIGDYDDDDNEIVGTFVGALLAASIPAAEHSTITSWGGRPGEIDAYRNMLRQFARSGSVVAVVSDSYDIYNACEFVWGETLREEVIGSGATIVIRPDSGDPLTVPVTVLDILGKKFGYAINSKGFKVLPPYIRVIQGDGINHTSLKILLKNIVAAGWSIDNIAFGMGGGLGQMVNRDDLKFAMKNSAAEVLGVWRDVFKDPIDDKGKGSKKGRFAVVAEDGELITLPLEGNAWRNLLQPIYENGFLIRKTTFEKVRTRSNGGIVADERVDATGIA